MARVRSIGHIALLAGEVLALTGYAQAQERPNILFCIADDASFHHFGKAGCPWVSTPAFDRVASEGIFFSRCYTPNAKSAPSRAILLTGRYSWQLKEGGNHITNFPAEFKVFTEVLSENGYRVGFTGKGWAPGNPGTIDGVPRKLTGEPFQARKTQAPTSAISANDYAMNFSDFLDAAKEGQPWFFWFGATEPHRAYEYGSGVAKGGKSPEMIDRVPAFWPDNETVRNDLLDYALEIEYYDLHVGRMISELERRGLLHNTVVIVTSDNGMPFPRAKGNHYEYSHHMPLAIMWPEGIAQKGRTDSEYVSFVDIAPSVLELAGIDAEKSGMQPVAGRSIVPALQGRSVGDPRSCLVFGRERDDYGRPENQGYPIRGIIRDEWMYIRNLKPWLAPAGNPETGYLDIDGSPTKTAMLDLWYSGQERRYYDLSMGLRPREELYRIDVDPDCMNNLADGPLYLEIKEALSEELDSILRAQQDPRMVGDGDVFDRYPFDTPDKSDFYEKVIRGEIPRPWERTKWVNPEDYDQYRKLMNR